MGGSADYVWDGERNRELSACRPCPCAVCSNHKGVGYLSFSDARGHGLTIWIDDEEVFRRLRSALKHFRKDHPSEISIVKQQQREGVLVAWRAVTDAIACLRQGRIELASSLLPIVQSALVAMLGELKRRRRLNPL